uniref:Uncharacterized protein n=1 Tax=Helicotheca tamesis TaxID=374047 RepID=A0A7S2E2W4_9STRA|mmetsp:Transcript_11862/g.16387  ORF Transcript_11862/g.16387 Transcript_11862/m.16387 type:complete len:435 (+) Transcript_11862:58-1362(+)
MADNEEDENDNNGREVTRPKKRPRNGDDNGNDIKMNSTKDNTEANGRKWKEKANLNGNDDDDDDEDIDNYDYSDEDDDYMGESSTTNKAAFLLSNFDPIEIVDSAAKHKPNLLLSVQTFANELKQHVDAAMASSSSSSHRIGSCIENGSDKGKKQLIMNQSGCTQCHKTVQQKNDLLRCSCLRDAAAAAPSSFSPSKNTGEQLCHQCIEREKGILGTCWYCFHPICPDCDYVNCEGDECAALSCLSCNNKLTKHTEGNDDDDDDEEEERFTSCACGNSCYCPDCTAEYKMLEMEQQEQNAEDIEKGGDGKFSSKFGTFCNNCEVLLECCNDQLLPSFTCIECYSKICEKCKFKFKCDNRDVVCENCMGMEYEHDDCDVCIAAATTGNGNGQHDEGGDKNGAKKGDTKGGTSKQGEIEDEESDDFDDIDDDEGDY